MIRDWIQGEWIDGCALSSGYAIVVVSGLDVICYTASASSAEPTEAWRVTSTMPIYYLRCAARTDTNEVRAIGLGITAGGVRTAEYFASTGQTTKGTAYGDWPVLLQYNADWIGYIARTAKTYTRWPFAGADPGPIANPFTVAGSSLGMIQVIASTVTWREFVPQTAATVGRPRTTTVSGVTLIYPMVVSGVTVGQSAGPPTNSAQILAAHDTTELSTIFPMAGETPHVAVLSDSTFLITSRTKSVELPPNEVEPGTSKYAAAAFALQMPPWDDYDARATSGPNKIYMPWDNKLTANQPMTDSKGVPSEIWQKAWMGITNRLQRPLDGQSVAFSGGGGGGGIPPSPAPVTQDADVLVGTDGTGFPNARTVTNTDSATWDVSVANQAKANVVPAWVLGKVSLRA